MYGTPRPRKRERWDGSNLDCRSANSGWEDCSKSLRILHEPTSRWLLGGGSKVAYATFTAKPIRQEDRGRCECGSTISDIAETRGSVV